MAISPYLASLRARVGHDLLHVPAVAVMIRDEAGRLLLVRNADTGEWQTVGGAMDPDEEPADAALREAFEETGLEVTLTGIIGVYGGPEFCLTYPNGDVVAYVGISFAARVVGGEERPCEDEVDGLVWVDAETARGLPLVAYTRRLVDDAFADDARTRFTPPVWQPPG